MLFVQVQVANQMKTLPSTNSSRRRSQAGAAMLESALVLVTVLSMVVFVMDMGRMLLLQQFFTERARSGVRAAVVNSWDATSVANFICYGSTSAPDGGTATAGYLGLLPAQVHFTTVADSGINDGRAVVKINGVRMFSWIPGIAGTYTAAPVVATMPMQSRGATN
jgi:Flp pilus assembly protein TadG